MSKIILFESAFENNYKEIECANGVTIAEVLPIYLDNAVIVVNGFQKDKDYVLQDGDFCTIRCFPEGNAGKARWTGLDYFLNVVTIGIYGIANTIYSAFTGETFVQSAIKNSFGDVSVDGKTQEQIEGIPQIRGAKNQTAKDKPYPIVLGKHLLTPYYIGSPYTDIGGTDGEDQYYNILLLLGYSKIKVTDIKLGNSVISKNTENVQNGMLAIDSSFPYKNSNPQLEIQSGDKECSLYQQKVYEEQLGIQLLRASDTPNTVIRFSAKNPMKVQVEIGMSALISYDDQGNKKNATVGVGVYWRLGSTGDWKPFAQFSGSNSYSSGVSTFTRQKAKNMRFVAERQFTYSEIVDDGQPLGGERIIEIKIERTTNQATDGRTTDGVTLTAIRTWCFDYTASKESKTLIPQVPMIAKDRDRTTRLALRIKATTELQGIINSINCIVQSYARIWDGESWSVEEQPTNNPASLALKMLQHTTLSYKAYSDDDINLEEFGKFYQFCSDNGFSCNGVVTKQTKLEDLLQVICATSRAFIIRDSSKLSVFIDNERNNYVAILNNQNMLPSINNSKSFDELPDGLRVKFIDEYDGYQENEIYVKYDGTTDIKPNEKFEDVSMPYVTDRDQIYKNGYFELAKKTLRPETWTRKVSIDGNVVYVGCLVQIQDDTLVVGIGDGAEIKEVILDDTGKYIVGVLTDGRFNISDTGKRYGVKILQADGINEPVIRTIEVNIDVPGYYNSFVFKSPISILETVKPEVGNILSFGEYDKITTDAIVLGKQDNGDGTFDLTLVPYDPEIYTFGGGMIPEFDSKVTPPTAQAGINELPADTVTKDDLYGSIGGIISGDKINIPSIPSNIIAVAKKEGIDLSCVITDTTISDSLNSVEWELFDGTERKQFTSNGKDTVYEFDRKADGYPEKENLDTWKVKARLVNIWGKAGEYSQEFSVNTDSYGTWKLQQPSITVSVSNRSVNLKIEQPERSDNREVYGNVKYRIEIKRPDIDTEFFKPSTRLDPYAGEQNYKDGTGYVTATGNYTQTLPLQGQNNDPPAPMATLYQYQVTAENEAGTGISAVVNATALATSVYDIVKGWYVNEHGEKVKIDGALGAESIYTESLAAISANMGDIKAGSISSTPEAGETKPNVLLDLDNEEFRIGNTPSLEASGSEDAEYIHYTKGQGLVMKIKNFVVTALASIISGVFRVKAKGTADSGSFFIVNPETTTDSTTGTPGRSTKFSGQIVGYKNIPIAPQYYELNLTSLSKEKWYPVFFNSRDMELALELHSPNVISASDYNHNTISIRWTEQGWTDTPKRLTVYNYGVYANTEITIMMLVAGTHIGGKAIYLRGGMLYRMRSNEVPDLKTSDYTYSDEMYPVVSGYTTGANTRIVWRADEMIASGAYNQLQNLKVVNSLTVTGATTTDSLDAESADIRDLTARYVNGTVLASDDTNTGIGNGTLMFNTTGQYNTAVGIKSLGNNSTGINNTAVGHQALTSNTTGTGNTAVGFRAIVNNTTGSGNIAVGRGALMTNITGKYNIALGDYRSCIKPDWNNQVNIGDRLRYIEFAASATQATVYNTMVSYYSESNGDTGAMGTFNDMEIMKVQRVNATTMYFVNNENRIPLSCTKGSASTLGHPLRIWFPDVSNDVPSTNK